MPLTRPVSSRKTVIEKMNDDRIYGRCFAVHCCFMLVAFLRHSAGSLTYHALWFGSCRGNFFFRTQSYFYFRPFFILKILNVLLPFFFPLVLQKCRAASVLKKVTDKIYTFDLGFLFHQMFFKKRLRPILEFLIFKNLCCFFYSRNIIFFFLRLLFCRFCYYHQMANPPRKKHRAKF